MDKYSFVIIKIEEGVCKRFKRKSIFKIQKICNTIEKKPIQIKEVLIL